MSLRKTIKAFFFLTSLGFHVFLRAAKGKNCLAEVEDPEIYHELTNWFSANNIWYVVSAI